MFKTSFRLALSSLALTGALLAPAAAAEFNPDIGGLALGLPIEDAQAAMTNINPDYKFRELKSGGKLLGVVGQEVRNDGHTLDAMFVLASGDGKVAQLSRYQRPESGNRVMIDGLKQALAEKYGDHMVAAEDAISSTFYWQQFRDGSFSDTLHQCSDTDGTIQAGNATIRYTDTFLEECTRKVVVSAVYDKHGLVDRFTVHVSDDGKQYDELNGVIVEQKEQSAQERDGAKSNKPKL